MFLPQSARSLESKNIRKKLTNCSWKFRVDSYSRIFFLSDLKNINIVCELLEVIVAKDHLKLKSEILLDHKEDEEIALNKATKK